MTISVREAVASKNPATIAAMEAYVRQNRAHRVAARRVALTIVGTALWVAACAKAVLDWWFPGQ